MIVICNFDSLISEGFWIATAIDTGFRISYFMTDFYALYKKDKGISWFQVVVGSERV